MFYVLKRCLTFFSVFLVSIMGFCQLEEDSLIKIRRSKFFTDVLARNYVIPFIHGSIEARTYMPLQSPLLRASPIEYISTKQGLLLHFGRSGKLYKMEDRGDSLLYFVRLDRTVNQNYNIGSYLFYSQGNIFELSGYGFWKSNGLLRQYNYTDQEWDIVPTNREVHLPLVSNGSCTAWIDTAGQYLYVPYQAVINDGLSNSLGESNIDPVSYRLDIKKRVWEELGEVTGPALKLFKTSNFITLPTEKGLFLGFNKGVYFADFTTNRISFLNDPPLVQSLLRLQSNSHSYYYDGWVYTLNMGSYKYDSVRIDPNKFVATGDLIWSKPRSSNVFLISLGILVSLGLLLLYLYRKRKQSKATPFSVASVAQPLQPFTETEQSLLQLLLSRSEKGLTANITDINYVLGLKDKSAGMQKKVRSDVMNNINEKYSFVTRQSIPLVQSIRSEADKRYFEYMINPDCREKLRQLLA